METVTSSSLPAFSVQSSAAILIQSTPRAINLATHHIRTVIKMNGMLKKTNTRAEIQFGATPLSPPQHAALNAVARAFGEKLDWLNRQNMELQGIESELRHLITRMRSLDPKNQQLRELVRIQIQLSGKTRTLSTLLPLLKARLATLNAYCFLPFPTFSQLTSALPPDMRLDAYVRRYT